MTTFAPYTTKTLKGVINILNRHNHFFKINSRNGPTADRLRGVIERRDFEEDDTVQKRLKAQLNRIKICCSSRLVIALKNTLKKSKNLCATLVYFIRSLRFNIDIQRELGNIDKVCNLGENQREVEFRLGKR